MLVDAHTHKYREYPEDKEVLQVVNVRNREEYDALRGKKNIRTSYGLHPWWIGMEEIDWSLMADVDIVGEIGIDKAIETPIGKQTELFEEQLRYARESGKDVIVHCVKAYNEVLLSLKRTGYKGRVLFHAYRSTIEMAQQLMKSCDACFSFGSREMSSEKCRKVKNTLPFDKVFWETDDE